jgi:catechol 2,3-dioxygenase-like lactoylglutathione lyase family enzyme
MNHKAISIRPFIGAKDYELSRNFYRDLGFEERIISSDMSLFITNQIGFYLQDAYVQDWIDNSMIFLEVDDVDRFWKELLALDLPTKYQRVKLTPIRKYDWGSECFLNDPAGVLWHFGQFKIKK